VVLIKVLVDTRATGCITQQLSMVCRCLLHSGYFDRVRVFCFPNTALPLLSFGEDGMQTFIEQAIWDSRQFVVRNLPLLETLILNEKWK
jgi:hypothetical protein